MHDTSNAVVRNIMNKARMVDPGRVGEKGSLFYSHGFQAMTRHFLEHTRFRAPWPC